VYQILAIIIDKENSGEKYFHTF